MSQFTTIGEGASSARVFRILPKDICSLSLDHGPVFFLAGPLTGGDDWQSGLCEGLFKLFPEGFTVAIPYGLEDRPSSDRPPFSKFTVLEALEHTTRQLPWERHYLDLAAGVSPSDGSWVPEQGCIIFWLPVESARYPKPPLHGPYAQDTRGELGEWRGRLMSDRSLRVVVGGHTDFPGFSTMERNFKFALGDDFVVYRSMRDTAAAAAAFCRKPAELKRLFKHLPLYDMTRHEKFEVADPPDDKHIRVVALFREGNKDISVHTEINRIDILLTPSTRIGDLEDLCGCDTDCTNCRIFSNWRDTSWGSSGDSVVDAAGLAAAFAGQTVFIGYCPK